MTKKQQQKQNKKTICHLAIIKIKKIKNKKIEGTNSSKIFVWCLCMHVWFCIYVRTGFVYWLEKRLLYEKSFDMSSCLWQSLIVLRWTCVVDRVLKSNLLTIVCSCQFWWSWLYFKATQLQVVFSWYFLYIYFFNINTSPPKQRSNLHGQGHSKGSTLQNMISLCIFCATVLNFLQLNFLGWYIIIGWSSMWTVLIVLFKFRVKM